MNRSEEYARQIEQDFQNENYYLNNIPPGLDIEEDVRPDEGDVPEMPEAIRNLDNEILEIDAIEALHGLSGIRWEYAEEDIRAMNGYEHGMHYLRPACGLTFASYKLFYNEFNTLVEPAWRDIRNWSHLVKAFEKLVRQTACPREMAYYITWLIRQLYNFEHIRETIELRVMYHDETGLPIEREGNA
jgi:hypothetical protein